MGIKKAGSHTTGDVLDFSHSGSINSHYKKCGFTHIDYDAMLRRQGYRCACCGSEKAYTNGSLKFHVDHCHETNKVRGLLCNACNKGIGALGDNLEGLLKAVRYLSRVEMGKRDKKPLPPRRRQYAKVNVWFSKAVNQYTLQYVHPKSLSRVQINARTMDRDEAIAKAVILEAKINRHHKPDESNAAQICAEAS